MKSRVLGALAGAAVLFGGLATTAAATPTTTPGAPGAQSYFDLARKDCVGTAREHALEGVVHGRRRRSVGHLLADRRRDQRPHSPVRGHRRAQLHRPPDPGHDHTGDPGPDGDELHVVASNSAHHYRITTTYIADPGARRGADATSLQRPVRRPAVRAARPARRRHRRRRLPERRRQLRALVDQRPEVPVDVNTNTTTDAVNRNYAVPTYMALEASNGFPTRASATRARQRRADDARRLPRAHSVHLGAGRARHADGRASPAAADRLRSTSRSGSGRPRRGRWPSPATRSSSASTTRASAYERQWVRYDEGLRRPSVGSASPRSASTTSRSTSSRPARTRRSPARSPPVSPRRGARRSRPAT